MKKNKQKRTMKQKVSQNVTVNIKNALPKPRRKRATGQSKSKSLSSQYTNPYLIGAFKQPITPPDSAVKKDITDMRKMIEQERQSNLLEAQGRAHQITAQNANVAGMQQMMHFGMNALMKEIKARPASSGVSIEDVSGRRGPYKKRVKPVEKSKSDIASNLQEQAQAQAQAIDEQGGGAGEWEDIEQPKPKARGGRPPGSRNKDIERVKGPISPMHARSQTAERTLEQELAISRAILQEHMPQGGGASVD